jgi:hypothetical protein
MLISFIGRTEKSAVVAMCVTEKQMSPPLGSAAIHFLLPGSQRTLWSRLCHSAMISKNSNFLKAMRLSGATLDEDDALLLDNVCNSTNWKFLTVLFQKLLISLQIFKISQNELLKLFFTTL